MPLVRYEIRCEHSLANPELYRSAARDDPEGLLEGVAMAGLVGIVRQLGDLAEYVSPNPNYMGKINAGLISHDDMEGLCVYTLSQLSQSLNPCHQIKALE